MTLHETSLHRALADERRARIVSELSAAEQGLDVSTLAARLRLHPNTVRWHLGILADAGLVESSAAARAAPGRPRILYRATKAEGDGKADEYRLLAAMLTGAVAQVPEGAARAEDAGRTWGMHLVETRSAPLSDDEASAEVVALLDQQGFAPEGAGSEIRMRRCPFHDLAETHPQIVCAVHRGLISGALARLGSELDVEALEIFVEPDLCIARLSRARA